LSLDAAKVDDRAVSREVDVGHGAAPTVWTRVPDAFDLDPALECLDAKRNIAAGHVLWFVSTGALSARCAFAFGAEAADDALLSHDMDSVGKLFDGGILSDPPMNIPQLQEAGEDCDDLFCQRRRV